MKEDRGGSDKMGREQEGSYKMEKRTGELVIRWEENKRGRDKMEREQERKG